MKDLQSHDLHITTTSLQNTATILIGENSPTPASQFQRDEQAKYTLIMLSKRLEVIALDISNRGWKHLYRLL
jgi:hypothetical protein